ncbi:TetR/AcrR family transcriptional regulator [Prauserella cavernicola]|uniref:TetR/AcrR family transcriptional regulator n=1 Tax=Prauserella cavernicola TaxID=2800127 RepID=UPI0027DC3DF5|nr:TetR/AcrR family transcriptional regulator [Prauserella cavernicola]
MDVVLEAAAQVFEREGIDATTNRIAERASVSIGTLYQYFPHKRALLLSLAERHLDAAQRRLAELSAELAATRPGWEETVGLIADAITGLHHDRPGLHAVLYEHTPRTPEAVEKLRALHEALAAELAGQLRRCGRGGDDAEHTAALLVHAVDAQLHRVLLGRESAGEDLTRTMLALSPDGRQG